MSGNRHPADRTRPLISPSSILILSGFLIGVASGHSLPTSSGQTVFFAGLIGVISYLGLSVAANRQHRRAQERANRVARSRLEQRLDRHNPRQLLKLNRRPRRRLSEMEEQYLPVVSTSRIRLR